MAEVGIIGAGAWGTAMGKALVDNGCSAELWSFEAEVASEINERSQNSRYLNGVDLPDNLTATTDILQAATGKDFIILAVPSPFVVDAVRSILASEDIIEGRCYLGVLSKGFVESQSGVKLIVDAVEDYLPGIYKGNTVYIAGPSHAEEVARGKLTGLISASTNGKNAIRFRELISNKRLVVFSSLDVRGVQISAAMKNVVAIAFGMLDALSETSDHIGDNTESLLLAAGLNEIQTLGTALGASHPETFTSIAGVGDLDVTCRSKYGRNRRFGREIITSQLLDNYSGIEDIIANIENLDYFAEGVVAAYFVNRLADEHNLSLPICRGVYGILNKRYPPAQAIETILSLLGRNRSAI
jgi:glycerol-3-phosphate dehydrogenase (NAD(P)+)